VKSSAEFHTMFQFSHKDH